MMPKLEIKPKLSIKDLLSYQYDPADYTQAVFHKHYQRLVQHRDDLQKRHDDKEEKRASLRQPDGKILNLQTRRALTNTPSANLSQGNRFSSLPDDDDGSYDQASTKPTLSATLSTYQLDKLFDNERKVAVAKIKEEIAAVKKEMKKQRRVVVVKTKGNMGREETENVTEERESQRAVQEDQDEKIESGQDLGWETVKSSRRR